ncbi:MAG: T9SS type A sorting domain-containing protein [Candidatus Coatesbacteria bacterium]|nr:MAG: T9SS type A sorting domain-containing protein [Candidatus Coatesbacteria bacterium]
MDEPLYDVTVNWYITTGTGDYDFAASPADRGIALTWDRNDENRAFNVYRSVGSDLGKAITTRDKLNGELITGEPPYSYLDAAVDEGATYSYWLEAVDVGGTSDTFGPVECTWNGALPTTYTLYQSRPNPAAGTATIAFDLPEDAKVTLTVYDISGRKVETIVNETLTAGSHERAVSALAPGVYMYKLDAGSFSAARKMVVQ